MTNCVSGWAMLNKETVVVPDIYQDGRSTAYGYTIPGGLIQYLRRTHF